MIQLLIDKSDSFELVRDQIALILVNEVASQMALAVTAGKDPNLWKLRIYTERAHPWEEFLNNEADRSPVVNIWYEVSNFDESASNIAERQAVTATYNIDCYGFGISQEDGPGHKPGDQEGVFAVQRAMRLVRNILMADIYTYLDLPRPFIWRRWFASSSRFQVQIDTTAIQNVPAARLPFFVMFNEFSPQYVAEELETVSVDINRAEDGQILVEADYTYPLP